MKIGVEMIPIFVSISYIIVSNRIIFLLHFGLKSYISVPNRITNSIWQTQFIPFPSPQTACN
jgi:hypothetical protein